MHKLPFPVVKQMNLLLLTLPFVGCWLLYYSDHIIAAGSERVTVLIILSYMIVCFYFCQKLDCFRVSLYHMRDIMFRQVLATLRILVDKDSTQGVSDDVAALTYREPSQRK